MPSESESSTPAASMTPRVFCKRCGYALVGLASNKCPECGREFDLANRRTFARRPPRGWIWRWGRRLLAVVLLLMLSAGAGLLWLWSGWHAEQKTIAQLRMRLTDLEYKPIGPERLRAVLGERLGYLARRVDFAEIWSLKAAETDQLDFRSLSHIQKLWLMDCELSNSNLSSLAGLPKLQGLTLYNLRMERADFGFFEKLPALSRLVLRGKWVASAGLEHIGALKHLKYLDLGGTGMKDANLQQLKGLSSLEQLSLSNNSISDVGLKHLQGLKSLRILSVDDKLRDSTGLEKLKQAIPALVVQYTNRAIE